MREGRTIDVFKLAPKRYAMGDARHALDERLKHAGYVKSGGFTLDRGVGRQNHFRQLFLPSKRFQYG